MARETRDLVIAVGCILAGIFWEQHVPYFFLCLVFLAGFRWLRLRRIFLRTPADLGIGLLAGLALCGLLISVKAETSFLQVLRLLSGILFYYIVFAWCRASEHSRLAVITMSLAAAGLAVLALFTVNWSLNKFTIIPESFYQVLRFRLQDSIHPNVMAGSLVLLLPAPVAVLLFRGRHSLLERLLLTGILLLSAGVLLLTKSRTGLAAFVAAMVVLAMLRWRWGWLLALTAGGLAVMLLVSFTPGLDLLLETTTGASTLALREEIWSRGLYLVRAFPLASPGMGMYGPLVDRLFPLLQNPPGSVPHAHNLFLQVAVDLGIPGLVAWLAVLLLSVQSAWLSFRSSPARTWQSSLAAALLASQAALVVHGLADSVTWGMVRTAPLVWAIWGLAAGSWAQHFPITERTDAAKS